MRCSNDMQHHKRSKAAYAPHSAGCVQDEEAHLHKDVLVLARHKLQADGRALQGHEGAIQGHARSKDWWPLRYCYLLQQL